MRFLIELQKTIATGRATLPTAGFVCAVLWMLFTHGNALLPVFFGLLLSACSVYLVAELNNNNSLLRNGSRMLSCMTAIMLTAITALHPVYIGHTLMLLYVIAYFFLFKTVQVPSPFHTFVIYFLISAASMLFSEILLLVPVYWVSQIYTRCLSFKCFIASLLAIIAPYWIYSAYFIYYDDYASLLHIAESLVSFHLPDYSGVTIEQLIQFFYVVLLLFVGVFDFYANSHKEKIKVRYMYISVIIHSFFWLLFIPFQPQYFYVVFPLLVVNSAILGGHYLALTYTKVSAIISVLFAILTLFVFFMPYIL